jgi:hypothetical protein
MERIKGRNRLYRRTDAMTGDDANSGDNETNASRINRTARFAWGAVVAISIAVIALIIYALAGPPPAPGVIQRVRTSSTVISALHRVPLSTFDSIGVSATFPLVEPTVLVGQPSLQSTSKPEVLFVGGEFCPFCAAERWPLIVTLSRFGRFVSLNNMQSSPQSVFPGVQTFSFVSTDYVSKYIALTGIELYSDSANRNGSFTQIAHLSLAESAVVQHYRNESASGLRVGTFPFVDIDNLLVTSTSGFSPAVIDGHSQSAIAQDLSQPHNPVGQAIVASANFLTAGVCRADGDRPSTVCDSSGVQLAAHSLKLS